MTGQSWQQRVSTMYVRQGRIFARLPSGTRTRKLTKVWAEPKPAQPTGPDQSSNPTQFPVPSQENGRMETDADYAPAPPPEDQNNGYMETDVEYGPASPPEGKGAPSDDEI